MQFRNIFRNIYILGGSGRQSLSRIANYICELNTFQIEVSKSYGMGEFKEDLKRLYNLTGVDVRPTTFLFNETQVILTTYYIYILNRY